MTQTQRPDTHENAPLAFMFWPQSWFLDPASAQSRLRKAQDGARNVQEAMQAASIAQLEDVVNAMSTISRLMSDAARSREVSAYAEVQPEVMRCLSRMGQTTQQRVLALTEKLSDCSMELAALSMEWRRPADAPANAPLAATGNDAKAASGRAG